MTDPTTTRRAPGPVVAGALIFAVTVGGLFALIGLASAGLGVVEALRGAAGAITGAAGLIVAVAVSWYLWRGKVWALAVAVVLSVGLSGAIVVLAAINGGRGAGVVICPLAILVGVVGCLVVPQSSRDWFLTPRVRSDARES